MIDGWVQRAVVIIAASLAYMWAGALIYLIVRQITPTDAMLAAVVGSYTGAAGFIFGMLVNMRVGAQRDFREPQQPEPPVQVQVVNEPADPVPVEPGGDQ